MWPAPGPCSEGTKPEEGALLSARARESAPYYERCKEGWYWYRERLPEKPEKPQKPGKERKRAALPRLLDRYSYQELWRMHPEEFRKVMAQYLEKAVQDPSEENVLDYVILLDLARRKSLAFAGAFAYVVQKYPELSGNLATYSYTPPGIRARAKLVQFEIDRLVSASRDRYGLLFFTSPGCRFCEVQRSILRRFAASYGWPVKEVSLASPEGEAAAERFGVVAVPEIVLVSREREDWMPVAVGVVSLSTLLDRLYRALMVMEGRMRPEEYLVWGFERETPANPLFFPDLSRIRKTVKEVRAE